MDVAPGPRHRQQIARVESRQHGPARGPVNARRRGVALGHGHNVVCAGNAVKASGDGAAEEKFFIPVGVDELQGAQCPRRVHDRHQQFPGRHFETVGTHVLLAQIGMSAASNGARPLLFSPRGGLSGKPRAFLLPHPAGALQVRLCDFQLLRTKRVFFFCAPCKGFAGSPVASFPSGDTVHIKHIPAGRPAGLVAVRRTPLHPVSSRGDAAAGVQSLGQQELTERFSGIHNAADPVANGPGILPRGRVEVEDSIHVRSL